MEKTSPQSKADRDIFMQKVTKKLEQIKANRQKKDSDHSETVDNRFYYYGCPY